MIELKNISKSYSGHHVILDHTNLKIETGEYLEIVGKSGSGKSTFLNLLGLLDSEYSGELLIDGILTSKLHDMQLSRLRNEKIGFVFQSYNLIPNMTVYENIVLPIIYSNQRLTGSLKKKVHDMAEEFAISELMQNKIQFLSGGEKQRVSIARALCLSPKIILADEPTGNLDQENSSIIFDTLSAQAKSGVTVILVTHNSYIDIGADRILRLEGGCFYDS